MHPFEQQVRERAYFIWEGEGRVSGHATDHWFRAEGELVADKPVQVRPVAAEISLAPSPARALKPRAGVRSAAAKAVETARPAKAAAGKAPAAKSAKATVTTKPPVTVTASDKAAAPRSALAKTAAPKSVAAKTATAKSVAAKTAAARSKAFGVETSAVMH